MAVPTVSLKPVSELAVYSWSEWDSVNLVKAALRDLEFGILQEAAQLVDAMGRDDRVSGTLLTRVEALPSLPFTMAVAEDATAKAKEVADEASESFEKMCPNEELLKLQHWGVMLGLGLGQLVWERSEGRWTPTLKVWHPRSCWYNLDAEKLFVYSREGQQEVTPGDGQWVVYAPYGIKRGWMYGKVRSLYVPWLVRQWGWRDWARKSEVHGIPIRKAHTPVSASEADKERFLREVARLGSESVIRLPKGATEAEQFDVSLLEAAAEGHLLFKDLLQMASDSIAICMLGQNLTTDVKGGAYAAAQVHENIRTDILRGDARSLGLCLKKQVFTPWARFNHGDESLAPLPSWSTDPPEDKSKLGDAMTKIGEGITALRQAGTHPDADDILESAGIPITEEAEEPEEMDPEEDPEEPADPADGGDEETERTLNHVMLARLPKKTRTSVIEGQLYLDKVVEEGKTEGNALMAPLTAELLQAVQSATSYNDLKKKLRAIYTGADLSKFADLVEKALMLAELEGRNAVLEEGD